MKEDLGEMVMIPQRTMGKHKRRQNRLPVTVSSIPGRETAVRVRLHGSLNAATYKDLIQKVVRLYESGKRYIYLDLSETPHIGYAGLVALHNIAVMLQGEDAPDPEYGWQAIHALERGIGDSTEKHLKILNPKPKVAEVLQRPCFLQFLDL
jgi:hypothetical protein